MIRKKSYAPTIDGKHGMTGLELSEADDLATMMTVDAVLGFTTHKMEKNFNAMSVDKRIKERWKTIMKEFIEDPKYDHTYQQLINNDKVKSIWKKDERFRHHIYRFLYLFDKRSGIEVRPCYRYENEGKCGAGIFATKEWDKGNQITTLFGCIAEIRNKDEEYFRENKNEFSVMYSTRKNCSQLWLGPAAYVNHDCKPNCRFTEGNHDCKMHLETLRDIQPGDELVIYYGNNFFGLENIECECFTCEVRGGGFFNSQSQYKEHQYQFGHSQYLKDDYLLHLDDEQQQPSPRSTASVLTRSSACRQRQKSRVTLPCASKALRYCPDSVHSSVTNSSDTMDRFNSNINGTLRGLKRSSNSYSFRVTYSRIDRIKKNIQRERHSVRRHRNTHVTATVTARSVSVAADDNDVMQVEVRADEDEEQDCYIVGESLKRCRTRSQRATQRQQQKRLMHQPQQPQQLHRPQQHQPQQHQPQKLTIKLRKSYNKPGCYDNCSSGASGSSSNDANIFSRMTEYLSSQSGSSPSDTPPSLSPWFQQQQQQHAHLTAASSVQLIDLAFTDQATATELTPPHLVCEVQQQPPPPPSANRGIVMKISRIHGNRFRSLLSS